METLGSHMGIEGGQKSQKKGTKKHTKGENEKNNQICKQHPVFQFVGEVIHEIIYTPRACTKKNLDSIPPIILVLGHILLVFGHFEPIQALFEPP